MLNTVCLLIFPAAMIMAACLDFFTMTIPNRLTIPFAALFPVVAYAAGMPLQEMGMHAAAGLMMLVIAFTFFSFGWIGGGDAKFVAAASLWLGWSTLFEYALWFSLLGAVLTLTLLYVRTIPLPAMLDREDWAVRLHDLRGGIPYGIALSIAGMLVYPSTIWMAEFARF